MSFKILFKAPALPPVGRLQSVDSRLSKKCFLTEKSDFIQAKISRVFFLIDLDICSFEIRFFQLIRGLKRAVTEELLHQILPVFFFFFLWGDRKGYFSPWLFFYFSGNVKTEADKRRLKSQSLSVLKPLNYNSSHIFSRR